MRRALVPLLLACACSASPAPAPAPPAPPPATEASPRAPWIELGGTPKDPIVVGHTAGGGKAWEVHTHVVDAALGAPDGGAYLVVEEPPLEASGRTTPVPTLVRIDAFGREAWRTPVEHGGGRWHLFVVEGSLLAFDLTVRGEHAPKHLHVIDAGTGAKVRDVDLDPHVGSVDARGGVAVVAEGDRVSRLGPAGDVAWSVRVRLFPAVGSPADRDADRKVAVGFDGTVITGASDGSLLAIDPDGKPLWQLGVRGAVSRIEARPGGDFVVRGGDGIATVVGPGGLVRRASASVEPAPPEAGRVVDLRPGKAAFDKPGAPPPWLPTAAYRADPQAPEGRPFGRVRAVVATAPDDVWALGHRVPMPGGDDSEARLYHFDGRAWSDLGVPTMRFPSEVYAEGKPASESSFTATGLARGPSGALLVIGVRGYDVRRPSVLERTDKGLRERRELLAALSSIPTGWEAALTYASSPRGREVLCNGAPPACVELGPDLAPRRLPDDQARKMNGVPAEVHPREGTTAIPLLFAGETLWKTSGWAGGEADVWGLDGSSTFHWSGSGVERRDPPLDGLRSAWAGGRDDLWLTGDQGVARFDGDRWWRIVGIDVAPGAANLTVTGSGRGDVWVYGDAGLWHVTADPRAQPDVEGARPPVPPASAPSAALPIAGVDPGYRLERVVLEVEGSRPLRAAVSLAEGPDGVIWLHEGARVLSHDGTRTRVIYEAPKPPPFVCWSTPEPDCELCTTCSDRRPKVLDCQRCAAPLAAGEGAVITEDGWLRIRGGRAAPDSIPIAGPLAVAATPSGALWAVSGAEGDLPHAAVEGPRGLRLVPGLPPAAYADVAARADDEVWMAGGLTTSASEAGVSPEGEGTLVRFDGHAFSRFRAPDGALLGVAAAGPGEAWAVGLGGGVLHAKGGTVEAFHLEREGGGRLPVILRGVAAAGPDEVWMVGDGSTLLRWDGKALRRVDASAAGKEAALSSVLAPGAKASMGGWVAGPGGIFRVVRAP